MSSGVSNLSQRVQQMPMANEILNPPVKKIILPALLIGNMAYKLGSEKNPEKQSDILWNSIISWLGGVILISKSLPYYVLPGVAGSMALFKMAQKNTPEEKKDTGINHLSWWLSGIATKKIINKIELGGPMTSFCSFAVGASVFGPFISNLIKTKLFPTILGDKTIDKEIATGLETINSGYPVGQQTNLNFNPFNDKNIPAASLSSGSYHDPYHLSQLIPNLYK